MNNLPTTFGQLLNQLETFEKECTAEELGAIDYDMFAEKVLTMLEQYRLKGEHYMGDDLVIEPNIPLPIPKRGRKSVNRELLDNMNIGDSVFFEGLVSKQVWNRYYNPSKAVGINITVQDVEGGARLWRVS